jgi:hypothetical protein
MRTPNNLNCDPQEHLTIGPFGTLKVSALGYLRPSQPRAEDNRFVSEAGPIRASGPCPEVTPGKHLVFWLF